jgi:5-methylcytosine-specific restriction endonuclease McrA
MSDAYISRPLRRALMERDEDRCLYCGATDSLTIDHVKAEKWEGKTRANNLAVACSECNTIKGVFPLDLFAEFMERLGRGKKQDIIDRVEAHLAIPTDPTE